MFISENNIIPEQRIKHILPGPYNGFITAAQINNALFVCYNGIVLEYHINDLVSLAYKGISVRNIYSNSGLRIVSTYSGIYGGKFEDFFEFTTQTKGGYSNGEFVKIRSQYFLCRDNLMQYDESTNSFETFLNFNPGQDIRQLIEFNNVVFGVFTNGLQAIDLESKTLLEEYIEDEISRAVKVGTKLIVVTRTGNIYMLSEKFEIEIIKTDFSFNDLEEIDGTLYLGGDAGLYKLEGNKIVSLLDFEIIELINFNGNLIFSNNTGLFAYINSRAVPIVNGIEFNRYGLTYDNALFYAGSINGLYYMSVFKLGAWLKDQKNITFLKEDNDIFQLHYLYYFLFIIFLIITVIIILTKRKKKGLLILKRNSEIEFSETFLIDLIKENEQIISVADLANKLQTSTVQLNRKLAKKNTTALEVLKDAKKEIAIELYKNGASIQKISNRVGYSERFIKQNFLKA